MRIGRLIYHFTRRTVTMIHTPTTVNWMFLILFFLIALISFYQSWENLVNKKFSKFSFDAMILALINRYGDKRTQKRAKISTRDPNRILVLGIYSLLLGIGAMYEIIRWFTKFSLN